MSEQTDKIGAAYAQIAESEGGKILMQWITETADDKRRAASKAGPNAAWGELKYADGLEAVATHINQMRTMGKR